MRILFAICHYYNPEGGKYASLRKNPKPRIVALSRQIAALRQLFGNRRCMLDIATRTAVPAGKALESTVDVLVCTTKGRHLLDKLPLPADLYRHVETDADPMLLGYECHAALAERAGDYDYYCFLEDDLVIHDPLFFLKQVWFNRSLGNIAVLQPNRFETAIKGPFNRVWVDGNLSESVTEKFQDLTEQSRIHARFLNMPMSFVRASNPHSGCFFLTAKQMEHFAAQPFFLDRTSDFIGPLESAASLGLMRTFRVYKTDPSYAPFLEIEHAGTSYTSLIGKDVAVSPAFDQVPAPRPMQDNIAISPAQPPAQPGPPKTGTKAARISDSGDGPNHGPNHGPNDGPNDGPGRGPKG